MLTRSMNDVEALSFSIVFVREEFFICAAGYDRIKRKGKDRERENCSGVDATAQLNLWVLASTPVQRRQWSINTTRYFLYESR